MIRKNSICRSRFLLILLVLSSCGLNDSDDVVCSKLVSSKGETIYVLSTNWGVTGDHQLSAVTTNKHKLNDSRDTAGDVKGLNPFEYRFNNDTLTLYFRNEINYHIAESFKTIAVQYQVMSSDYYEHRDTSFHAVPDLQPNTASDSPKPPSE